MEWRFQRNVTLITNGQIEFRGYPILYLRQHGARLLHPRAFGRIPDGIGGGADGSCQHLPSAVAGSAAGAKLLPAELAPSPAKVEMPLRLRYIRGGALPVRILHVLHPHSSGKQALCRPIIRRGTSLDVLAELSLISSFQAPPDWATHIHALPAFEPTLAGMRLRFRKCLRFRSMRGAIGRENAPKRSLRRKSPGFVLVRRA
jgi:hypothetical protein